MNKPLYQAIWKNAIEKGGIVENDTEGMKRASYRDFYIYENERLYHNY